MNSSEIKSFLSFEKSLPIIYGSADSEKRLLSNYTKEVKKIEDIPLAYEKLRASLKEKDWGFWLYQKMAEKKEKRDYCLCVSIRA